MEKKQVLLSSIVFILFLFSMLFVSAHGKVDAAVVGAQSEGNFVIANLGTIIFVVAIILLVPVAYKYFKKSKSKKEIKAEELIIYVPLLLLSYIYFVHGMQALKLNPEYITLVMVLPFPYAIVKVLVFLVGIIDMLVIVALLFRLRTWLLVYASIWPVVPVILGYVSSGHFAWQEILFAPILAFIAYKLHLRKNTV